MKRWPFHVLLTLARNIFLTVCLYMYSLFLIDSICKIRGICYLSEIKKEHPLIFQGSCLDSIFSKIQTHVLSFSKVFYCFSMFFYGFYCFSIAFLLFYYWFSMVSYCFSIGFLLVFYGFLSFSIVSLRFLAPDFWLLWNDFCFSFPGHFSSQGPRVTPVTLGQRSENMLSVCPIRLCYLSEIHYIIFLVHFVCFLDV